MQEGKVFIFSAPSGSGKTTIVKHLLKRFPFLAFSVSATTRGRRGAEVNGRDYYFYSLEDFQKMIRRGEMVEWEEVYPGKFYGTLKSEVQRIWEAGKHAVFDVDVVGGLNLKKYFGDKALAIFIKVSSRDILEKRLRERSSDSTESIRQRVAKAEEESLLADQFDTVLINDHLPSALENAEILVKRFVENSRKASVNPSSK